MTREHEPPYADLTPHAGSATDVAPLGRSKGKPPHERTADEDRDVVTGTARRYRGVQVAAESEGQVRRPGHGVLHRLLLLPAAARGLRAAADGAKSNGVVNVAYLFALSQFFMAWIVAWAYVRAAARFDRMARDVIDKGGRSVPSSPDVLGIHRDHAVDHVVGRAQERRLDRVLRGGTIAESVAERHRRSGRLHERRVVLGIAGIIAFKATTASCIPSAGSSRISRCS